jgi:hypothetical protein
MPPCEEELWEDDEEEEDELEGDDPPPPVAGLSEPPLPISPSSGATISEQP